MGSSTSTTSMHSSHPARPVDHQHGPLGATDLPSTMVSPVHPRQATSSHERAFLAALSKPLPGTQEEKKAEVVVVVVRRSLTTTRFPSITSAKDLQTSVQPSLRVASRAMTTSGKTDVTGVGRSTTGMSASSNPLSPGESKTTSPKHSTTHFPHMPAATAYPNNKLMPIAPPPALAHLVGHQQDAVRSIVERPRSAHSRHGLIRPVPQKVAPVEVEPQTQVKIGVSQIQPAEQAPAQPTAEKPSAVAPSSHETTVEAKKPDASVCPPTDDTIPLQTAQAYSALYQMYSEDCPQYQVYKSRWREQQTAYAEARATRTHSTYSRSLYTPEPDVRSTASSPIGSPFPAPLSPAAGCCSPMNSARGSVGSVGSGAASPAFEITEYPSLDGLSLVQEGTALCLLVESSRPASVCASPISGWKLVAPANSPLSSTVSPIRLASPRSSNLSSASVSPSAAHRRIVSQPTVSFSTSVHGSPVHAEHVKAEKAKLSSPTPPSKPLPSTATAGLQSLPVDNKIPVRRRIQVRQSSLEIPMPVA